MNDYIARCGATHSHFGRLLAHGSDGPDTENWTTAGDVGGLIQQAMEGRLINAERSQQFIGYMKMSQDQPYLSVGITSTWPLATKTGFLEGVRNDVTLFYSPQRATGELLMIAMSDGASNAQEEAALAELGSTVFPQILEIRTLLTPEVNTIGAH